MKLISSHLTIKHRLVIMAVFTLGLFFTSCKDDKLNVPFNAGTIRFAETSYVVELNNPEASTIVLPLSLPLEEDAVVDVVIDNQSTILPSEYTVSPAIPATGLKLELKKGAVEASFQINSLNNFEGDKTLVLKLVAAKGGLTVSNTNFSTTITLRGNPVLYPELRSSVNELAFGSNANGTITPSQSYVLSGSKLSADVTLVSSANYEISLDDNVFTNAITIPLSVISASSVTVYARFVPNTGVNQPIVGSITHSSATVPNVVVRASGVETGNVVAGVLLAKNDMAYGASAGALIGLSSSAWVGFSATGSNAVQYTPTGLSYTGYAGSGVGGAAVMENRSNSSEDISWTFGSQTSGVVYTAQLLSLASAPATNDFFISLGDGAAGATPSYYNRIYAKATGAQYQLGIGRNSTTVAYDATNLNYNTTYLMVHKYEFLTGVSTMYIISGTIPAVEPSAGATSSSPSSDPSALTRYVIRQSTQIPLKATIDGIRVATSWKEAVGL